MSNSAVFNSGCCGESSNALTSQRTRRASTADEEGCAADFNPVEEARSDKRAQKLSPSLDEQTLDAKAREIGQYGREIGLR